jgi:hypothetical protein
MNLNYEDDCKNGFANEADHDANCTRCARPAVFYVNIPDRSTLEALAFMLQQTTQRVRDYDGAVVKPPTCFEINWNNGLPANITTQHQWLGHGKAAKCTPRFFGQVYDGNVIDLGPSAWAAAAFAIGACR